MEAKKPTPEPVYTVELLDAIYKMRHIQDQKGMVAREIYRRCPEIVVSDKVLEDALKDLPDPAAWSEATE